MKKSLINGAVVGGVSAGIAGLFHGSFSAKAVIWGLAAGAVANWLLVQVNPTSSV